MITPTYWNGEPCEARQVRVTVADSPGFPAYWAGGLIGTERDAVEVTYNGETFYIDDDDFTEEQELPEVKRIREQFQLTFHHPAGHGWQKVTEGRGGPAWPSSSLAVVEGSVKPRA